MADIKVVCKHCGNTFYVSEHSAGVTVTCPVCNRETPKPPQAVRASKLRLREETAAAGVVSEPTSRAGAPNISVPPSPPGSIAPAAEAKRPPPPPDVYDRVHVMRQKPARIHTIFGWLTFIFLGGVLLWLQWSVASATGYGRYYYPARIFIGALVIIWTLMSAFEDSSLQGILCIVFPPYSAYYVFVQADSAILRGTYAAFLLSLGAELYYLRDTSLLMQAQQVLLRFVGATSDLIDRASAPPVKP